MIALLVLSAVPAALVLSLLTAIVVAVRGYTAATPAVVGPPPARLGALLRRLWIAERMMLAMETPVG